MVCVGVLATEASHLTEYFSSTYQLMVRALLKTTLVCVGVHATEVSVYCGHSILGEIEN